MLHLKKKCLFLLFVSSAFALEVEPSVGYTASTYYGSSFTSSLSSQTFTGSGLALGLRLQTNWLLWGRLGLEAGFSPNMRWSSPNLFFNTSSTAENGMNYRIGIIAGFVTPLLPFRFWAGFHFVDRITIGTTTLRGGAVKAGLSFSVLPILMFNLELNRSVYSTGSSISTFFTGKFFNKHPGDTAINSLIVSVSTPMSI
jgi:hypothetical protein